MCHLVTYDIVHFEVNKLWKEGGEKPSTVKYRLVELSVFNMLFEAL